MGRIFIYTNNPTAGGTDGVQVSIGKVPGEVGYQPIVLGPFDVTTNQTAQAKLAVRALAGYMASGSVILTPVGANAAYISLALDGDESLGAWNSPGDSLALQGVTDSNTCFWIKAQGDQAEDPQNDTSIKLQLDALTIAK